MEISNQEYNSLLQRQEAIIEDMLGVAAAVEKLNNSLGKQIAQQIAGFAAKQAGVQIQIPKSLAYASFGLLGLIPQVFEDNKMRKYEARLKELETEYNANSTRIKEIEDFLFPDTSKSINKNVASNNNQNSTNKGVWTFVIFSIVVVVTIAFIKKKRAAIA